METPIQYAARVAVEEHFARERRRLIQRGSLLIGCLIIVGLVLFSHGIIVVPS